MFDILILFNRKNELRVICLNLIKVERMKAGLSQNELARRSGVKQSVISDIESGKTKQPRVDTVQQIAKVLGFEWTTYFSA